METSDPFIKNKIEKEIRTKKLRNKFGDENPTKIKNQKKVIEHINSINIIQNVKRICLNSASRQIQTA